MDETLSMTTAETGLCPVQLHSMSKASSCVGSHRRFQSAV